MPLDDLIASFGPDGRDFERLCRWLLQNVPEYRVRLEQVWLWNDWPNREGRPDAGIDLVAEERGGGLWAIQAKHYDPAYAIKKADVDSFLSESARTEFTYRLLIATTDHWGRPPGARSTIKRSRSGRSCALTSQPLRSSGHTPSTDSRLLM